MIGFANCIMMKIYVLKIKIKYLLISHSQVFVKIIWERCQRGGQGQMKDVREVIILGRVVKWNSLHLKDLRKLLKF